MMVGVVASRLRIWGELRPVDGDGKSLRARAECWRRWYLWTGMRVSVLEAEDSGAFSLSDVDGDEGVAFLLLLVLAFSVFLMVFAVPLRG